MVLPCIWTAAVQTACSVSKVLCNGLHCEVCISLHQLADTLDYSNSILLIC